MRDANIARLREPLGIILGWVELLRRGRLSGEAAERALEAIARNARLQASVIEDLAKNQSAPLALKKARRRFQASSASSLRKLGR
jgi:hypothetical protein